MNYRFLDQFYTVAETGSVTQAAQLLYVTQPAISRNIKVLEEEVGAPLFEKKGRNLELTDYGKILFQRVKKMKMELQFAEDEIEAYKKGEAGVVRAGAGFVWMLNFIPNVVTRFYQENRNAQLILEAATTEILIEKLNNNEIDFLVARLGNVDPVDFQQEKLLEFEIVVVCSATHPLAKSRKNHWRDFKNYDWACYKYDLQVFDQLGKIYAKENMGSPRIVFQTHLLISLMMVVSQSDLLSVISSQLLPEAKKIRIGPSTWFGGCESICQRFLYAPIQNFIPYHSQIHRHDPTACKIRF